MDCEKAFEWMSVYLDKQLDKDSSEKLMEHIEQCAHCKKEFELLKSIVEQLNNIPLVELPQGYHEELMQKIQEIPKETVIQYPVGKKGKEKGKKEKKEKKKWNWKRYSAIAAGFLILIAAGSSKSLMRMGESDGVNMAPQNRDTAESAPMMMAEEAGYTEEAPTEEAEYLTAQDTEYVNTEQKQRSFQQAEERKKIKRINMNMTVKSFDAAMKQIQNTAFNNGGYVESYYSDVYYSDKAKGIDLKQGTVVLRLPSENYETAKNSLNQIGEIGNVNETTEDITSEYVDTESRLKMKRIEEERLLELLEKSESVEEILKIEERLGNVRTEIESYTTAIQNWDRLVKYSTITISITEQEESKINEVPSSDFSVQVKNSFVKSINFLINFGQSIVIVLAAAIVPVIILIVLAVVVIFIIKKKKKKK